MHQHVHRYSDRDEFRRSVAAHVCACASESIDHRGCFTLVLAGGRTPQPIYEILGKPRCRTNIDWEHVYILWGDERIVPRDHPDSNFRMAYDSLLSRVPIPGRNVLRVPVEAGNPESIASEYEELIRQAIRVDDDGLPRFDMVLLGMGADGHTASLFHGEPALREKHRWVVAVDGKGGVPLVPRITMTLPLINNARRVVFMVSGSEKIPIADEIQNDQDGATAKYPAAMIQPKGELVWFVSE